MRRRGWEPGNEAQGMGAWEWDTQGDGSLGMRCRGLEPGNETQGMRAWEWDTQGMGAWE